MKLILALFSFALAKVAPQVKTDVDCTACEMYADFFDWSFCGDKINGNYPFNDDECTIYYNCWNGQTFCQECDIYKFDPNFEHQFIFDGEGEDDFGNIVMKGHCDYVGADTCPGVNNAYPVNHKGANRVCPSASTAAPTTTTTATTTTSKSGPTAAPKNCNTLCDLYKYSGDFDFTFCAGKMNGNYPFNDAECSVYYNCWESQTYCQECDIYKYDPNFEHQFIYDGEGEDDLGRTVMKGHCDYRGVDTCPGTNNEFPIHSKTQDEIDGLWRQCNGGSVTTTAQPSTSTTTLQPTTTTAEATTTAQATTTTATTTTTSKPATTTVTVTTTNAPKQTTTTVLSSTTPASEIECTACEMYADVFDWSFCAGKMNGNYPFNDDECSVYYNCWEGQTYCQECDIYKFDPNYEHQFIFDGEDTDDFGNLVMKGHCDFVGVDTCPGINNEYPVNHKGPGRTCPSASTAAPTTPSTTPTTRNTASTDAPKNCNTLCDLYKFSGDFDFTFCAGKMNGNYPFNDAECSVYYNCWEDQTYCQECDIYKYDPNFEHQFIYDGEGEDDLGRTVMKGHCDYRGVDTCPGTNNEFPAHTKSQDEIDDLWEQCNGDSTTTKPGTTTAATATTSEAATTTKKPSTTIPVTDDMCQTYKDAGKWDDSFCSGRLNGDYPFNDENCNMYVSCWEGRAYCMQCNIYYTDFEQVTVYDGEGWNDETLEDGSPDKQWVSKIHCDAIGTMVCPAKEELEDVFGFPTHHLD